MLDDSWIEKLYPAKTKGHTVIVGTEKQAIIQPAETFDTLESGVQRQADKLIDF